MQLRKIIIKKTGDYDDWFSSLTIKEQVQVDSRLERIKKYSYFGDSRNLNDGLYELRWKNGWRVYFSRITEGIILLHGGLKNDQEKDIKRARINLRRYGHS